MMLDDLLYTKMSDDVKSWNGKKGFVTRKSHNYYESSEHRSSYSTAQKGAV
jgi:hypothetical protein